MKFCGAPLETHLSASIFTHFHRSSPTKIPWFYDRRGQSIKKCCRWHQLVTQLKRDLFLKAKLKNYFAHLWKNLEKFEEKGDKDWHEGAHNAWGSEWGLIAHISLADWTVLKIVFEDCAGIELTTLATAWSSYLLNATGC